MQQRRLAPPRVRHDLDVRPRARFQRPRAEHRERSVAVVEQRRAAAQQGPVHVDVGGAQHASRLTRDGGHEGHRAVGRPARGGPYRRAPRDADLGAPAPRPRGPDPRGAPPQGRRGRPPQRHRQPLQPPGRGDPCRLGRPDDRHHRHRLRQVALLPAPHPRRPLPRRPRPRALPLPDEGARPGPGARAQQLRRQERPARDLRRRHAARAALGDPPQQQHRPHQPRHAAPRDPPEPPRVGELPLQPRDRGRRRGARLPRRVRLPRRQRAQTAAAHRRRLRHRPALPDGERHDRQPRRARRAPLRPRRLHRHRARRLARHQAHDRDVEPAGHRREARHPPLRARPRPPTCWPSWSPSKRARSCS